MYLLQDLAKDFLSINGFPSYETLVLGPNFCREENERIHTRQQQCRLRSIPFHLNGD